ncbi:hypothetical protein PAMP_009411 [Pampus punctatissimus]
MKRLPSKSASSEASEKKIKFSKSEVQILIEQEVRSAVKKNETKLQSLAETIERLNCVDYETSIQKLEARVKMVTKRAEAAFSHMMKTQKKVDVVRTHSEAEAMETTSQRKSPAIDRQTESPDCMDMRRDVFQMMESTKKALKKMRADNDDLTAPTADLNENLPHQHTTYGSSESKGHLRLIKMDPDNHQESENKVKEFKQLKEAKSVSVKQGCLSHAESNSPKHSGPEQVEDEFFYPPLPTTTFPSIMSIEAASYNIPQRVKVHLALIKQPPGLSVLWNVDEEHPSDPPMDSYSIFITMEKVKGCGVFSDWKTLGEVRAIPLPMCVMISKYKPGHKMCVAVVGKDTFGRYGPYSKVVTAVIPD